ncbi:uncharacterized protein L201_005463 [Kwoniella dendrophila CBS 6074]|uniref:Uncharacterized protein n=1 Tax=Kwoniella dendrophila CBS 6074 TaxID=1295534 RepID=A0AAX4JYV5_9TREE
MAEENTFICTFLGDIQSGTAENSTQDVEQSIENHSNEYGTFDSEVNYEGPFKPQKDAGNYGVPTVEYCNATAKSTSEHASAHYDNFIKYHVRGETGTSLLIKYDCGHFAIIGDVPDNAESRLFVGSKMLNCFVSYDHHTLSAD